MMRRVADKPQSRRWVVEEEEMEREVGTQEDGDVEKREEKWNN